MHTIAIVVPVFVDVGAASCVMVPVVPGAPVSMIVVPAVSIPELLVVALTIIGTAFISMIPPVIIVRCANRDSEGE